MPLLRPLAVLLSALASLLLAGAALRGRPAGPRRRASRTGELRAIARRRSSALATSGEPRAAPILEALAAGQLYVRKSDKRVFIGKADGNQLRSTDAIDRQAAPARDAEAELEPRPRQQPAARRDRGRASARSRLLSPDPRRRAAAPPRRCSSAAMPTALPALDRRWPPRRTRASSARMSRRAPPACSPSDAPTAQKLDGDRRCCARAATAMRSACCIAAGRQPSDGEVKAAAAAGAASIEQTLAAWEAAQNVWYGISLGSVLLLAAIGLAITFGVMGVINMAHGEMVMLGAYTTFVVQEVIRTSAPAPVRRLAADRAAARLPGRRAASAS